MKANSKVSIEQCREIMNRDGLKYTDEELHVIRDFMYLIADITRSHYERIQEKNKIIDINENNCDHETKSLFIRPGQYRRAS
ncbi:MAG: hypothetical protein SGI83_01000 [Bacteroidota bacterium]|nr:hypothetical protein [Bacteroidota bacterium]